MDPLHGSEYYPSSHNHGSEKWVPPTVVTFQTQPFFTSMITGERVLRTTPTGSNQSSTRRCKEMGTQYTCKVCLTSKKGGVCSYNIYIIYIYMYVQYRQYMYFKNYWIPESNYQPERCWNKHSCPHPRSPPMGAFLPFEGAAWATEVSQHPDVIETPPRGQVSAELFRRKNLAGEVLIKPDKIWWKTWHSFGLKVGNEFIARLQVAMPTPHCFKKNTCLAWRRAPLGAEFWLLSHSKACHFDSLQSLQAICTCRVFPLDEWGRTGPSERHKQNHPGGWLHSNIIEKRVDLTSEILLRSWFICSYNVVHDQWFLV